MFPRRGLHRDTAAGYYFHISAKEVGIACGVYAPGPEELRKIRNFLADNYELFQKTAAAAKKLMGTVARNHLAAHAKRFRSRASRRRSDQAEAVVLVGGTRPEAGDNSPAENRSCKAIPCHGGDDRTFESASIGENERKRRFSEEFGVRWIMKIKAFAKRQSARKF